MTPALHLRVREGGGGDVVVVTWQRRHEGVLVVDRYQIASLGQHATSHPSSEVREDPLCSTLGAREGGGAVGTEMDPLRLTVGVREGVVP